jgi:hypothetical protein
MISFDLLYLALLTLYFMSCRHRKYSEFIFELEDCKAVDHPELEISVRTVTAVMHLSIKKHANEDFTGTRKGSDYTWTTYKEMGILAVSFAKGLSATCPWLAAEKELSKIGFYSKNNEDMMVGMIAAFLSGITVVPLYDTLGKVYRINMMVQGKGRGELEGGVGERMGPL